MKPSYHGAPLEKERKTSVFRSGSAKVSDSGKRPAELTPLLEAAARNARTTENVAGATLSALESQGEKLQSASGHVS